MNFNRLVSEWAWRVNDGMPDPQNRTHVELLRQVLIESGYEEDWVLEYTQNLFEVNDDTVIKYKEDGETKTMKAGSAKTMPNEHPAKRAWDKLQDKGGSDSESDEKEKEVDDTKLSAKDGDFIRKAGEKDDTKVKTSIEDKNKEKPKEKETKGTAIEGNQEQIISTIASRQTNLGEDRKIGLAGAGGAKASEGESVYTSAVKEAKVTESTNEEKEALRNRKDGRGRANYPNSEEKLILEDLGLESNSDEAADYLISREKYAKARLEEVKNYKLSERQQQRKQELESKEKLNKKEKSELKKLNSNVFESKSGFNGKEGDYLDWAKTAYDGGIRTLELLEDSRMDTSKPLEMVQSTGEIDDDVEATILSKRDSFEPGSDDYKYYDKELKSFQKFRTYHDTYAVGQDEKGRMFVVHVTNKKASDLADPHFNTTVSKRFRSLKENEDPESEKVIQVLENAIDKTTNFKQNTVDSVATIEVDDNFTKLAEEAIPKRLEEIKERGLKKKDKLNNWLTDNGISSKDWEGMNTKTRLQTVQKFTGDMDWHKNNGNVETDEDGNTYPKLAYDPYGRMFVKVGEEAKLKKHAELVSNSQGLQKAIEIKRQEADVVSIQHKAVVDGIAEADKEKGYPKTDENGNVIENGPHTKRYIERVMEDIHYTTYIDMDEEDDDKVIAQMGIKGAKPSHIRNCLAKQSGYEGDPSDKNALKSHIINTASISEDRKFITIGKDKKELIKDEYRLAAPGTKAVSYFGKSIKDCVSKSVAASRSGK